MQQVSVRELRQNASQWLRKVQQGDSFEITDRGRPVALLTPLPQGSRWDRLIATGRIRPATIPWESIPPPLPATPGQRSLSDILEEMRADER
jgi:prevent-host-death family protein